MQEKEHPILGEIDYLVHEYPIVFSIIALILLIIGIKFTLGQLANTVAKANDTVTEMIDEMIEPIVEYRTYKVVKCDMDRAYLRLDKYTVVLQSESDSLIFDSEIDYDNFLPYLGKDVNLKIIRHGVREDYEGFIEYEIIEFK